MLYTNEKRLDRLAWLRTNSETSFGSKLKKQKFLFFYEMFSKVKGEAYSLNYLKAYPNGPVFSEVYGDETYRFDEFNYRINEIQNEANINETIGKAAETLVSTFTEEELSNLTHQFDLWQSKEDRIKSGERDINISEEDITENDIIQLKSLYNTYSNLASQNVKVIPVFDKIFIISNADYGKLKPEHHEVIEILSRDSELENPVYLELEGEVLLVD
ncbi:hypothetical protein I4Q36_07140 [Tuanshanicoccus lijuaniae]|uniref:hypothetical protein n=1 Tax=Aerococcaceae bacterium zg-1292 TaxID=2774330 RepID=UPI0019366EA4|nr:hypothetical protein [Aerococcaceae bacterium zg-1292]QQA36584.1 hypothetical protein I4Q36_07140 [Aerococcaceae bacterium zg-1292]